MRLQLCSFLVASLAAIPAFADQPEGDGRPVGASIGIGAGYVFPADFQQVGAAGVRLMLANGITFEPGVEISYGSVSNEVANNTTTDTNVAVVLRTAVRYPFLTRGPMGLIIGGSAGVGFASVDPEGSDNGRSSTSIDARWLFSVEYWLSQHWNVSFNADNPFLEYSKTSMEVAGTSDNTQSFFHVGLIYAPRIGLFAHMFF